MQSPLRSTKIRRHGWALCGFDAKIAHKRIRIMKKDWRDQAAKFEAPDGRWRFGLNLTGTDGMGSAQFWWGRLMPQLQRIALHMGRAKWARLYVDDLLAPFKIRSWLDRWQQSAELRMRCC